MLEQKLRPVDSLFENTRRWAVTGPQAKAIPKRRRFGIEAYRRQEEPDKDSNQAYDPRSDFKDWDRSAGKRMSFHFEIIFKAAQ